MNLNIKFTSDFEFVKSIISLPTQIYRPYMQKVNLYNFNLMFLTLNLQYLNSDFVSKQVIFSIQVAKGKETTQITNM